MIPRRILKSPLLRTLTVASVVAVAVMGLTALGVFEGIELSVYDLWINQNRTPDAVNARIAILEITEADIQQEYPQSDATLAGILNAFEGYGPRAIGVDIYRSQPVGPGTSELENGFLLNPDIVAVTRFGGYDAEDSVPPPPVLEGSDQVGFADLILDDDQNVRRGLVLLNPEGRAGEFALGLRLASRYLASEGVPVRFDESGEGLELGSTTVPRFRTGDGGYVGADDGGFQFLLDFADGRFPTFRKADVLSGAVNPDLIEGKIILVGQTAPSLEDTFVTPVSGRGGEAAEMQGVEVHARIASQLIRLARGESAPIVPAPPLSEWIAIVVLALAGTCAGARFPAPMLVVAGVASGVVVLIVGAFTAFSLSWWIPVVPSAASWAIAAPMGAWLARVAETKIFLSYAREDVDRVRTLRERLRQEGYTPWMDIWDIPSGARWETEIRRGIYQSDFFLACLSRRSVEKEGVILQEIREAIALWDQKLDGDAYLIPVRLEDCEIPEELSSLQWVSVHEDGGWERLRDAIERTMGRRGVARRRA